MSLRYKMNERVLLQRRVAAQDGAGQPVEDWQAVVPDGDGKLWAEVRDISGKEFLAAGAEQAEVQTRIVIRARDGIEASMRVLHGTDVYRIVAPLRRSDGSLHLMCAKGVK